MDKKNTQSLVVEIEDLKEVVGGADAARAVAAAPAQGQTAGAVAGRSIGTLPKMATDGKCGW